jgi:hypothetical protein
MKLPSIRAINGYSKPENLANLISDLELAAEESEGQQEKAIGQLIKAANARFVQIAGQSYEDWVNGAIAQVSEEVAVEPEPVAPPVDELLSQVENLIEASNAYLERRAGWKETAREFAALLTALDEAHAKARRSIQAAVDADCAPYLEAKERLLKEVLRTEGTSLKSRDQARQLIEKLERKMAEIEASYGAERAQVTARLEAQFGAQFDKLEKAIRVASDESRAEDGREQVLALVESGWYELHKGQKNRAESASVFIRRGFAQLGRQLKGG